MRLATYASLTAVNALIALSLLAGSATPGAVCFYPSTAKHYDSQGYAGYTFKTTRGGLFIVETKGNTGAAICTEKRMSPAEKRLNKIFDVDC